MGWDVFIVPVIYFRAECEVGFKPDVSLGKCEWMGELCNTEAQADAQAQAHRREHAVGWEKYMKEMEK